MGTLVNQSAEGGRGGVLVPKTSLTSDFTKVGGEKKRQTLAYTQKRKRRKELLSMNKSQKLR